MDETGNLSKNLGIFSTLNAATEIKWSILSIIFILVTDNYLLCIKEPGLYEFFLYPTKIQTISLPLQLIFVLVIFSLLMSTIFPILYYIATSTYDRCFSYWIDKLFSYNQDNFSKLTNYVTLDELREAAYTNKDKFLLDIYDDYKKILANKMALIKCVSSYSFYVLTLLTVNYFNFDKGISRVFYQHLGNNNYIFLTILCLIVLTFFYSHITLDERIYCPSLYNEINRDNFINMQAPPFPANNLQSKQEPN